MRRLAIRASALAILGALCLAALEGVVRGFALGGGSFFEPDPVVGSWHRPNAEGSVREACFHSRVRMNSHGMHDVERSLARSSGVQRIAVLGDSFVEAMQVPIDDSLTRRLEVELEKMPPGRRVEALNFGMSGFGTTQEYLTYRSRALAFAPDVVILAFFPGNDIEDNSPELSGDPNRPHFRLGADGVLSLLPFEPYHVRPAVAWLKEHFQAYGWLVVRAARIPALRRVLVHRTDPVLLRPTDEGSNLARPGQSPDPGEASGARPVDPREQSWLVVEALIRRLAQETASHGQRFLLVVLPDTNALEEAAAKSTKSVEANAPSTLSAAASRLGRLCDEGALDCVMLEAAFRAAILSGQNELDRLILPCDGHLSSAGHALAARETAHYIVSHGLLTPPSATPPSGTRSR